jgi:hypothetical protein
VSDNCRSVSFLRKEIGPWDYHDLCVLLFKLSNQLTTETWYELNATGCQLKCVHLYLLQLLITITFELFNRFSKKFDTNNDRLCGLVVRVSGYRSRGVGFDSQRYQIFWEVVSLERGPLSLVSTIKELLGRNNSGFGLENREYGREDPLRWPRGTLYRQKLALTRPKIGGHSIGIVRLRTKATEFVCFWYEYYVIRCNLKFEYFNFLHRVIIIWPTSEIIRWQRQ